MLADAFQYCNGRMVRETAATVVKQRGERDNSFWKKPKPPTRRHAEQCLCSSCPITTFILSVSWPHVC